MAGRPSRWLLWQRLGLRAQVMIIGAGLFIVFGMGVGALAERALHHRLVTRDADRLTAWAAAAVGGQDLPPGLTVRTGVEDPVGVHEGRTDLVVVTDVVRDGTPHRVEITGSLLEVQRVLRELRIALVLGGASALMALSLVLFVTASTFTRRLKSLVVRARQLDEHGRESPVGDEVQALAGSFNRLEEDLRRAMRRLAKERDRFRTALSNMDEAVFALGRTGRIKLANRAALELLRKTDKDVRNHHLTELITSPELEALLAKVGELEVGQTETVEFALPGPMKRQLLARLTPHRETKGASLAVVDVTELRRLVSMRQDFVANVSHELRTPVAVLRANVEALLDGAMDDKERATGFLEAMRRNVERLTNLIDDLLDLARIESGGFDPELKPVRVADAVGAVGDVLAERIEQKDTRVKLQLESGASVLADRQGLEQVLINLVENAVKYTPEKSTITIGTRRVRDGWIELYVSDNGPGIPAEHHARLFERFYRVDEGRSKAMGGTGLGLSIVKHLVSGMDGAIAVRDNEPKGTVFSFELRDAKAVSARPAQVMPDTKVNA